MAIDANGNITSYAVTETLGAQTQANGTNQVVMVDDIQANPGNGGNVVGTDYVGRVVILRRGTATEETRRVLTDTAGTGATRILTMSQDWVVPPASGNEINVFYNLADLDGSGTAFALDGRTGFYEAAEELILGNGTAPAGIWFGDGQLVQLVDSKSNTAYALTVNANARFQYGLIRNGTPISGGYLFGLNNSSGEAFINISGEFYFINSALVSPITPLNFNVASTAVVYMEGSSSFQASNDADLSGSTSSSRIIDTSFTGAGTTLEVANIRPNAIYENIVFNNMYDLRTLTSGTLRLKNCIWVAMTNYITITNAADVWNIINPSWPVTSHTDLTFNAAGTVNEKTSVEITVVDTAASPISNVVVAVYEGLLTQNLDLKTATNASGVVDDSFTYKVYTSTATVTNGNHALRVDGWTYNPFITALVSNVPYISSITLATDTFISETNQATALSNGSGITWNEDTNPSSLIEFTSGTSTLSVGQTVTGGTSGATGIVTQILDGDSVAGTVHLRSRNGVSFSASETISNGSGWSATFTSGSELRYSIWIGGNSLSLQTVYDYLAALTSQTTLSATGELIHEWGNQNQARALYSTGSTFFTERSGTKGVIVVNASGNVEKYTSNNGEFYIPPVQYTFSLTGLQDGTEIRIYNSSTNVAIAGVENMTGGVDVGTTATTGVTVGGGINNNTFNYFYTYSGDIPIFVVVQNFNYQYLKIQNLTLTDANQSIPVTQIIDRNYSDPD